MFNSIKFMCEKNWQVERSSTHVTWVIKKSKKGQGDKMQPAWVRLVFTAAPNNNTYHLHLQCTYPPITRSDVRILPPIVRHWARSRSRVSGDSNGWTRGADMTTHEQALEDPWKAPLIWTSPNVHTAVFSLQDPAGIRVGGDRWGRSGHRRGWTLWWVWL